MLYIGNVRDLFDNIDDNVEIRIGTVNAMIPVDSVEIALGDSENKKPQYVTLKCNVDDFIQLAELLKKNDKKL